MSQIVACPKCHKHYRIDDRAAGQKMKCPQCQTVFSAAAGVPGPAGATTAQPRPSTAPSSPARTRGQLVAGPQLFPNEVPTGPDPLANHVIEDPGFAIVDIDEVRRKRLAQQRRQGIELSIDPLEKFRADAEAEKAKIQLQDRQSRMAILFGLAAAAVLVVLLAAGYIVALNTRAGFHILLYSSLAGLVVFLMVNLLIVQHVKNHHPKQSLWYALLPPYRVYYWVKNWSDFRAYAMTEIALLVPLVIGICLVVHFNTKYHMGYF